MTILHTIVDRKIRFSGGKGIKYFGLYSRQRRAGQGCPRPYNTYLVALQNLPPQALFLQALDADAADGVMQVLAAGIDLHAVRGVAGEPAVLDLLKEHVLLRAAHGGQKFAVQLGGGGDGAGGAVGLLRAGELARHGGGGRSRAAGIGEDVDHGKAAGAGKGEGFGEFLLRLAGEADDQVRRDGAAGEPFLQHADALQIARRVIVAVHAAQHAVAAALQAQVELRAEIRARGKAAAEVLVHHARLERAKAHAELRYGPADGFDQIGKRAAVLEIAAPRCDLDAREHDLAVALQRARLLHGLRQRQRAHRPAGVGDDAVGAEIAAAVLHLEHGAGARAEAPGRERLKGAAAHGVVQQDLLPGVLPGLFLPHGVQHELDKGLASAAAGHDVHAESFDLPGADPVSYTHLMAAAM